MPKLAIITTHPIQYYAPLFKQLNQRGKIELKVFYTWSQTKDKKYDPDFKKEVAWDVPLLHGYDYTFVNNVSTAPGSRHFKGIDNPTLIAEINDWGADAVLVFGWAFKSHLKVLRHYKGKLPVYFRGDSNLLDEMQGVSLRKILRQAFLTWVYRHIDVALYVGDTNKAYYRKYGVPIEKLVYAPHAIDNARFAGATNEDRQQNRNEWRWQRGIQPGETIFLFVGKLTRKKDPVNLLKAFLSIKANNFRLLFVGNGDLENELKERAKNEPSVLFVDFKNQSQMPLMYNIGDVFVLPSVGPGETWGLAANEAMACSKPVIVSDRCGCAMDLVEEGKNGYIFKAGDMESLKSALRRFTNSSMDLKSMGDASFEKVSGFSFDAICGAIEGVMK